MPHRDPNSHRSDPETTFDRWLDGFVTGTPAGEAARKDATGSLAQAISGARHLHGLAAGPAATVAARRRIEEELMQRGALAAAGGTIWTPNHERMLRAPWWTKASPVLATAAVVALIVALVASLVWTQRPIPSPDEGNAPGFAAASPEPSSTGGSDLLIVRGLPADEARALSDRVGVIDSDGLIVYLPDSDPIELPGVNEIIPIGIPGRALVTWLDGSRNVVDVTTWETLFELPDVSERENYANPYLFLSESGENADWMIYDLRTGESRPLSEIVELPNDQLAIPVQSGQPGAGPGQADVVSHFVSPEYEVSPTSDIPRFVIAGSLDHATTLDGYPPATQAVGHYPVVSPDDESVAWITAEPESAIIIVETTTGDELARVDVDDLGPGAQLAGFTNDNESLVVTTFDRIWLISWSSGEPEQRIIVEGVQAVSNVPFHAPSGSLYWIEHWTLSRATIPDGNVTVVDPVLSPRTIGFTANGAPWIVAAAGGNAALIDARTGEIVSQLGDVPANEAEFNAVSTSTSLDGSTFIQVIGGSDSGYLVSPEFPDGLELTVPIDPEIIAASDAPNGIPVYYDLSPDGSRVVAGTLDMDAGYVPRYIAPVDADPEWTQIEPGVTNLYWIPMPVMDPDDDDAETLPAMDLPSPVATPAGAQASCGAPGYAPVVSGGVDADALAALGEVGPPIILTDDSVTLPFGMDGETTLPGNSAQLPGVPGVYSSYDPKDGSRTVTNVMLGETWEFPALDYIGVADAPAQGVMSFAIAGPFVVGPVDTSGFDYRIVDTRTGESVLASDLLGGTFPWMVHVAATGLHESDRQAVQFTRAYHGFPDISDERRASTGEAAERKFHDTMALILPGSVSVAAIVDLGGVTDRADPAVFSQDGTRVAWRGWTDVDGEGSFAFLVADANDLANPRVLMRINLPLGNEPLMFSSDGETLYVRTGNSIQAKPVDGGPVEQLVVGGQDPLGIVSINADAQTIVFSMGGEESAATRLVDLNTGVTIDLPALDEYPVWDTRADDGYLAQSSSVAPSEVPEDGGPGEVIVLDTATGEIVYREELTIERDPEVGLAGIRNIEMLEAGFVVTRSASQSGSADILSVIDATTGASWNLEEPAGLTDDDLTRYRVSPSGTCLLLTVERVTGNDGDRLITEHVGSWVVPLTSEGEWTELPFALVDWWQVPALDGTP